MTPLLTLAIPYYRNARYLGPAIASVLAQRDPRWRLIVSDGGGDLEGKGRAVVVAVRDERVRYLPPTGLSGIAANWNRCLDAAETDLVALLHDDDELTPDYVGRMAAEAERDPSAAILFCEAKVIGPEGRETFSIPDFSKRFLRPRPGRVVVLQGEPGLAALLRGNFIMCPTMCYRLSRLGGRRFSSNWGQVLDLDLTARLLLEGERLVGLPDVLYSYRRHGDSTTAQQTQSLVRFQEEVALYDWLASRSAERGWCRAAGIGRGKTIIKLNLGFCILLDLLRADWRAARSKAGMICRIL